MSEREIFIEARKQSDATSRAAFLEAACAGDVVVRQRVERLLRAEGEHDGLVDSPAVALLTDVEQTTTNALDSSVALGSNPRQGDEAWRQILIPSTQADSQGRIGHYEVMGVLGTGGFGVVLRALDTVLNRVVAVKLLAPQLAVSVSSRQRFLREARSSAAIRHKNVVQVYAVVEQPLPYLVMEFLPGETLQQRMDRVGSLPVTDVIEIGRQVAEGLAAAHATGLIHRDVKPANVFLEQIEGLPNALSVKLLDFGLARAVDDVSITQNGMIIGTPLYMSPEQARGVPLDRRADLFSLGSVLYAMTTGHSPFRAGNTLATLKRVNEDTPQPIHELAPETPLWLCDLTTQLLAKDPAERIQSAREVVDRLGRANGGLSPDERSGTAASRYRPRRLGTVIGAAVAGVVLLAAIVFLLPTRNGVVRIKIEGLSTEEQTQIQVEVLGNGDSRVVDAAHGWEIAVKEGEYTARVRGGSDLVEIKDRRVTVTRGQQAIVRVTTKPTVAASTKVVTAPSVIPDTDAVHEPTTAPPPAIAPFDADQAKQHQAAWARHLDVPVEFTNSIGMKFVLIPPGEFVMGSPPDEIEAHLKELEVEVTDATLQTEWRKRVLSGAPQHKVLLTQPTYLGIHEVTQQQYETVMGTNPAHFSSSGPGHESVANLDTRNHPVEMVSWNDAAEFCAKLSAAEQQRPFYFRIGDAVTQLTGNGYRLPTEAGWEFACRGGTTTQFWNGDSHENLNEVGWSRGNFGGRTHAVGELQVNPFGLFDVHGNLYEWVEDLWDPTYYEQFSEQAAIDPLGPPPAHYARVVRGGTWGDPALFCRASARQAYESDQSFLGIGFRVSLTVDAVQESLSRGGSAIAPSPAIAPFDAVQAKQHQEAWAEHLDVPVEFTNSIGMKFVLIPPGEFTMGSPPEEIEAHLKEVSEAKNQPAYYLKQWQELIQSTVPRHQVVLTQPIYLGIHEVTQQQYETVLGINPSHFSKTGPGRDAVANLDTQNHPVEMVSWYDAAEFCAQLSKSEQRKPFYSRIADAVTQLDGNGYRLPTEAGWEFACRAGTTTRFWHGEQNDNRIQVGWSSHSSGGRTHAVGELRANPFGLFDVHGNVGEWVEDSCDNQYYKQFSERAAIDPMGPQPALRGRQIRGGTWGDPAIFCRSACRSGNSAADSNNGLGFRVSLPIEAVRESLKPQPEPQPTSTTNAGSYSWPAEAPPPAIAPFDADQAKQHQAAWAQHHGVPVDYTNSIGMKFVLIPPGEFRMGSPPAEFAASVEAARDSKFYQGFVMTEVPQHGVILTQPFYLGITEVTQRDYTTVVGANPSHFSSTGTGQAAAANLDTQNYPVEMVDWNDAAWFCVQLSQRETLSPTYDVVEGVPATPKAGNGYRLPTEAEWEYACRAGSTTRNWFGDRDADLEAAAWGLTNSNDRPHSVGELHSNPWGLFDVNGNVWEWVQDGFDPDNYARFTERTAIDPAAVGGQRMIRGGDWKSSKTFFYSAFRGRLAPWVPKSDVGFRVTLSVEAVQRALPGQPQK